MNPAPDNIGEDWEAQLAEYSFGVMDTANAAEFERKLNECRSHVMLAQEYSEVTGLLAFTAAPMEPAAGHKSRFMARLATTPQEQQAQDSTTPALDFASIRAALPPRTTTAPVRTQFETTRAPAAGDNGRITDLGEYRKQRARISMTAMGAIAAALLLLVGGTAWITSMLAKPAPPQITAVRVNGTDAQPNAFAFCVLDTKTNEAYLVANSLQPISANQVYELWWLPTGDKPPIAAGTFTTDQNGNAHHTVKAPDPITSYAGVAVTLEQAPGGPAPGGPIVLVGKYDLH